MKKACRQTIFDDPIVGEVRKAGDEMAREAGYDIHVLCERLRETERQHPERLAKARSCAAADER